MFQKTKNIDAAFRHIRLFSFIFLAACSATCIFVSYKSYQLVPFARIVVNKATSAGCMVADSFGNARSNVSGGMASNEAT